MKIRNEYWYRHSRSDVKSSQYRLAVLNPVGAFMFDGKAVPRSADMKTTKILLSYNETTERENINNNTVSVGTKFKPNSSKSPVIMRAYSPDRHYNRMSTPNSEKEEIEKAEIRKDRVAKYKHLFFDDNYVIHPVSKLGRDVSLLLPATHSVESFDKLMNKKLSIVK
jgi:hypothetical protein